MMSYAHSTEGVVNASLEFDIKTLRPTYKLTIGLPGRSNALAIATRLGLAPEIISAAKGEVNPENIRADKLLDDIRKERNRTGREREKTAKARKRTEDINRELEARLEAIEEERREVLAQARAEAELEVAILKKNIEALKKQLKNARQPLEALKKVEAEIEEIEEKVEKPVERKSKKSHPAGTVPVKSNQSPLKLGEKVVVSTLNAEGLVTALGESDAEVQVGSLRVRAKLSDLSRVSKGQESDESSKLKVEGSKSTNLRPSTLNLQPSPGLELDIRGQISEDALDMLDRYLDQAYSAGLPFVRIIHGKGTGKLRQVVREALQDHVHVTSFEEGGPKEGGEGVTVAKIG